MVPQNLHGRYLIGYYTFVLFLCGHGLAQWLEGFSCGEREGKDACRNRREDWSWAALVTIALLVHGFALRFVLARYFLPDLG
jgi:hypothetical protein